MEPLRPLIPESIGAIQPGSAPGAVPGPGRGGTSIDCLRYSSAELEVGSWEAEDDERVRWVRVVGLDDGESLQRLAARFGLHPLVVEDIVNTHQRPKIEDWGDYLFVVARTPGADAADEQVAFILNATTVISFECRECERFSPVERRLREGRGRIRSGGASYLLHALLDTAIDGWFGTLDGLAQRLAGLEADILGGPRRDVLDAIWRERRELAGVGAVIAPHRDVTTRLARGEFELISQRHEVFFRDCADHVLHLTDLVTRLGETARGLMDLHVSLSGQRANERMNVLTVVATIFIPLTFVTGLYGMNFDTGSPWNMPELRWRYGYPMVLVVMFLSAVVLVLMFRRQGWFGGVAGSRETPP